MKTGNGQQQAREETLPGMGPASGSGDPAAHAGAPTTERLTERAHAGIDEASQVAGRAERKVRDAAGKASAEMDARGHQAMDQLTSQIKDNPLLAAGVAFGIGFLASSLIRR